MGNPDPLNGKGKNGENNDPKNDENPIVPPFPWPKSVTAREPIVIKFKDRVKNILAMPDGKTALVNSSDAVGRDAFLATIDTSTGQEMSRFPIGAFDLHGMALHPNGKSLAVVGHKITPPGPPSNDNYKFQLFDLTSRQYVKAFLGPRTWVQSVAISPDGQMAATGGEAGDTSVRLWNLATGQEIRNLGEPFGGRGCAEFAFTPDGKNLIGRNAHGPANEAKIILWEATTGQPVHEWNGFPGGLHDMDLSPDAELLVVTYTTFNSVGVKVFNLKTKSEVLSLDGPAFHGVTFGPDAKTIIVAGRDRSIRVFRLDTGEQLGGFQGHTEMIHRLALMPDEKTLVSLSYDRTIRIWDLGSLDSLPPIKNLKLTHLSS